MNMLYITPEVVQASLTRSWKSKEFNIDDVTEWCAQVELNLIEDITTMIQFEEVGVVMEHSRVKLPCNIFKIDDVYDDSERRVSYKNQGTYLYDVKDIYDNLLEDGDTVYLNYIGIPVTPDGDIQISSDHIFPCETFCLIRTFSEDAALGKFDRGMISMWESKLGGQVSAAKGSLRHLDADYKDKLIVIRGNMLPKIGQMPLKHKMFKR